MKQIYVNCAQLETRVAVMENNRLVELLIERTVNHRMVGNIYKGRVADILPGMQAAFIDIGSGRNAFLYVDDCLPNGTEDRENRRPSINELLTEGQEILVQVTKEPFGTKGPRVTTQISLPGRYLVYMSDGEYIGVSRKLARQDERDRLHSLAEALCEGKEGLIVRTAATGTAEQELRADFLRLRTMWKGIKEKAATAKPPSLVYSDLELVPRMIRDLLQEDVEHILIDSQAEFNRVISRFAETVPSLREKIQLYREKTGLFDAYGIEAEIEKALRKKVWLKSGGYLVIDQTEALTVIDVNTGKFTGTRTLEETVYKTNLEAAAEIARQLRLRDIGGIIIIDFIDMTKPEFRDQVAKTLNEELKRDRTRSHLLGFTSLGLLEMTRKKVRHNLNDTLTQACPYCEGKGRLQSVETVTARLEREIREYTGGVDHEAVLVELHPRLAEPLLEHKEEQLKELERHTGVHIFIRENESSGPEHYRIVYIGSTDEARRRAEAQSTFLDRHR